MKLAYVVAPYRTETIYGIVVNIQRAEHLALQMWKLGYAVICPHKNTALFDGAMPDEVWLKGDLVMLARCDVCVFATGWERSSGCRAERQFCIDHGIRIFEEADIIYKPAEYRCGGGIWEKEEIPNG